MSGSIVEAVDGLVTSPWVHLVLFTVAAVDGFFPLVPAETLVIAVGAWAAATGDPNLLLIVLIAAVGAFVGDHISYAIGRRIGRRIFSDHPPDGRRQRLHDRVCRLLERRGGLVIVVARYIPGGRTAATLTAGATRYPRPLFSRYDAIGAATWAIYSTGLGYIGGAAFREQPIKAVALGLAIAFAITAGYEGVRFVRDRRRRPSP